jgi:hypothetical protein
VSLTTSSIAVSGCFFQPGGWPMRIGWQRLSDLRLVCLSPTVPALVPLRHVPGLPAGKADGVPVDVLHGVGQRPDAARETKSRSPARRANGMERGRYLASSRAFISAAYSASLRKNLP